MKKVISGTLVAKCLACIASLTMILSLAGCGAASGGATPGPAAASTEAAAAQQATSEAATQQATSEAATQQATSEAATQQAAPTPTTISIWFPSISAAGTQDNPISREITKATGVTMNIITGDSDKFKTLLATGDLPDIICANFASENVVASAILNSGVLLPLDSMMDKDAPDITKNYSAAIDYSKKFLSSGQNKLYFLPSQVYNSNPDNPDISRRGMSCGYLIKWDNYAQAGYPQIASQDDFLNVLKNMQDTAPAVDGIKVYAFSGWSDWGIWPWYIPYIYDMGAHDVPNDLIIDDVNGTAYNLYDDSSLVWDSLKFYNKAYNMGLIDPDAFTMKYNDYINKLNAGQMLTTYGSWMADTANTTLAAAGHNDQGYEGINAGFPYKQGIYSKDAPLGTGIDWSWAITQNCKNPDSALAFLNYTYSDAGVRLIFSGIQDKDWGINNGHVYLIDYPDENYAAEEGLIYYALAGCAGSQIIGDGYPASIAEDNDIKSGNNYNPNPKPKVKTVDDDFCSHYGTDFQFAGQVWADMAKNNKVMTTTTFWPFSLLIDSPSDADVSTQAKVDQYMQVQVTKMIMAASDDEFNSLEAESKAGIKSLGYDTVIANMTALINKAQDDAKTLNIN